MDSVKDMLLLLISSSIVSNIVLSQFMGLCPFWEYPVRSRLQAVWEPRLFSS